MKIPRESGYCDLLYRHNCFTGKYTTRKIHKKLHPGPEWFIFHNLTREFIDDVISAISLYYFIDVFLSIIKRTLHGGLKI